MPTILKIATIPGQSHAIQAKFQEQFTARLEAVKAPGNYKDPEKIDQYIAAERQKIVVSASEDRGKLALSGETGEIIAAALLTTDGENPGVATFSRTIEQPEAALIVDLMASIENADAVFGHGIEWDMRFLFQRATLLGVCTESLRTDLYTCAMNPILFDFGLMWRGTERRGAFDDLSETFGCGRGVMRSNEVWAKVQAGDYESVRTFLVDRVIRMAKVYNRIYGIEASPQVEMDLAGGAAE